MPAFKPALLFAVSTSAQLSITASDMPVSGDTLRWSAAAVTPATNLSAYTQTGAPFTWNFSSLTPVTQGVDVYKAALAVSPLYFSISPTAYGYKVADSLPVPNLPISVKEVYTFYSKKGSPSRFVAEGFGAKISGVSVPATYSDEDELYFFPLTLGRTDSSTYYLNVSVSGLGRLIQSGTRITRVDGEGTVQTPYTAGAKACLRVRTEITGIDSVTAGGIAFGLPRHWVEYKWLAKGEHYPLMWVTTEITPTGQQTPASIRYRDVARASLSISATVAAPKSLSVFTDATARIFRLFLPAGWEKNTVEVFDIGGRLVHTAQNEAQINGGNLPAGIYLLRVTTTQGVGYAKAVL